MTINVLITVPLEEDLIQRLNEISEDLNISVIPSRQAAEIPDETWQETEVLFTLAILPDPEQAPNLRWIQSYYAGIDQITRSAISQKNDLIITTMSGANALQVAEYSLMMMLSLGHQLQGLIAAQNRSNWLSNKREVYKPQELSESTIGIVGYGRIGRQIARLLHGFGAEVLATKRNAKVPTDPGYTPKGTGDPQGDFFSRLYPPEAINTMLKECDYVIVTLPLTPDTKGLFNAKQFNAMKPSAYLIDVSRGEVIDHEDLINALVQHKIAGAGLDVFPKEPLPADSLLWQMPNVIITPHVAGLSVEYENRGIDLFIKNLNLYLENQPLLNQADLTKGY